MNGADTAEYGSAFAKTLANCWQTVKCWQIWGSRRYQACASSLARSEKFACPFASPRQAPCRPLARSNELHKHESVVDYVGSHLCIA